MIEQFRVGDIIKVFYANRNYRLAKVIAEKGPKIVVEFCDNREERNYRKWEPRLSIASPKDIARYKQWFLQKRKETEGKKK